MGTAGTRLLGAAVAAAMALGACGDDAEESGSRQATTLSPTALVRLLPQDARAYSTVDVSALKRGLGVATDADPNRDRELNAFVSLTLNGLYAGIPKQAVIDALNLSSASALAASGGEGVPVTAVATNADPAEIEQALLDLGFVDRDGVLEGPDGARATHESFIGRIETVSSGREVRSTRVPHDATAVKFVDGGFLVSDDGDLLRTLGSEADEDPLEVQGELEGDATQALLVESNCIIELGIATSADGSGELIFLLDQEPDPSRLDSLGSAGFGEPRAEGDQLVVPIDLDAAEPPADFIARTLPGYDCGS